MDKINSQYQRYLNKTGQKPPEATGKKYFTVPSNYHETPDNSNKETQDEEC